MIKGAYTIFNNMNSDEYTDQEKLHSIKDVLSLVTYNSITKNSIISAFRWLYDYCLEEASKPTTNGDKIRAMTDEELADAIMNNHNIASAIDFCRSDEECTDYLDSGNFLPEEWCRKCLIRWLKEEIRENEVAADDK